MQHDAAYYEQQALASVAKAREDESGEWSWYYMGEAQVYATLALASIQDAPPHDLRPEYPRLRTPPKPGARDEGLDPKPRNVVQSDGPRCEECHGPLGPLEPEDSIELFGRVICNKCGKELS